MTTKTKIIIGIVGLAVIGGAYYFYKKNKDKKAKGDVLKNAKLKEDCAKSGGTWDEETQTCKPKGEYIAKDDERYGKGLGVLALPKQPIPTTTTTTETNKPNASTPNFTKGIF